jgi:rhamnogalacturonyl hydrolase YesR
MFGYAIKLGVDAGLLKEKTYEQAYQKSWLALSKKLNEKG